MGSHANWGDMFMVYLFHEHLMRVRHTELTAIWSHCAAEWERYLFYLRVTQTKEGPKIQHWARRPDDSDPKAVLQDSLLSFSNWYFPFSNIWNPGPTEAVTNKSVMRPQSCLPLATTCQWLVLADVCLSTSIPARRVLSLPATAKPSCHWPGKITPTVTTKKIRSCKVNFLSV